MHDYNFSSNFHEGQIGEKAVSVMLKALGVKHSTTGAPNSQRDEMGRALPDFKAMISRGGVSRKTFIEVKTESAFYYCPTRRHWHSGIKKDLLKDYCEVSAEKAVDCLIIAIKRNHQPQREYFSMKPPAGVWVCNAFDLQRFGYEKLNKERKPLQSSARLIDAGIWRPLAPWHEASQSIQLKKETNPEAWHSFFNSEMPSSIIFSEG
jgi:hypothetical protein